MPPCSQHGGKKHVWGENMSYVKNMVKTTKNELRLKYGTAISLNVITAWIMYINPTAGTVSFAVVSVLLYSMDIGDIIKPLLIFAILPQLLSTLGLGSTVPGLDIVSSILPMILIISILDKLDLGKWGEKLKPALILPYVIQLISTLGGTTTDLTQLMSVVNLMVYIGVLSAVFDEL